MDAQICTTRLDDQYPSHRHPAGAWSLPGRAFIRSKILTLRLQWRKRRKVNRNTPEIGDASPSLGYTKMKRNKCLIETEIRQHQALDQRRHFLAPRGCGRPGIHVRTRPSETWSLQIGFCATWVQRAPKHPAQRQSDTQAWRISLCFRNRHGCANRVAIDMKWKPITELAKEIHEGDPSIRNTWPLTYWSKEPFQAKPE